MRPALPAQIAAAMAAWPALSRADRADVGRALRRLGWSYTEISRAIDTPRSTVAGWCREVALTLDQIAAIRQRTAPQGGIPRDTQRKRRAEVEAIRQDARAFARRHLDDSLFVAGTVMYWAEGAKTTHPLALTHADPAALRLFIAWARRFHGPNAEFVLALHLHDGNDEPAARAWWADAVGLPRAAFTKTFVKNEGTGHRKNHLPHGVCRVRMRRSADAWHRTLAWIRVVASAHGAPTT